MLITWSSFSLHFLSPPGIALAGQSPQPERAGWKSLGHPVTHTFWQEVPGHELNAPQPHRCHRSLQNSCPAEGTSCTYAHSSAFLQGLDTCGSSLNAPKAPYQDVHQDHTVCLGPSFLRKAEVLYTEATSHLKMLSSSGKSASTWAFL